jgi:hypothetical protein
MYASARQPPSSGHPSSATAGWSAVRLLAEHSRRSTIKAHVHRLQGEQRIKAELADKTSAIQG